MNTLEILQIYMHIETKTIQLSQSVCFDLFLENSNGRICTIMSSFFLFCKTKLEKQKNYCLLSFEKKSIAKMNTLFYETFFSLWIGNRWKQREKKQCVGSRKIAPEENCLPTLNLTLYLIQTLTLIGAIVRIPVCLKKVAIQYNYCFHWYLCWVIL